jgi:DNA-binding NarL/FixJ family response regulator
MKKALVFVISNILVWETIRLLQKSRTGFPLLSSQEQEILNLITEGYTDNEIAEYLHVGKRTIERSLFNIPKKLGLRDMSSAIGYAVEKGLANIAYA